MGGAAGQLLRLGDDGLCVHCVRLQALHPARQQLFIYLFIVGLYLAQSTTQGHLRASERQRQQVMVMHIPFTTDCPFFLFFFSFFFLRCSFVFEGGMGEEIWSCFCCYILEYLNKKTIFFFRRGSFFLRFISFFCFLILDLPSMDVFLHCMLFFVN